MDWRKLPIARSMRFVLYIGAANHDATPEQRRLLAQSILPLLDQYREDGDETPVRLAIRSVMGPHWHPTGDWGEFIRSLELEENDAGSGPEPGASA